MTPLPEIDLKELEELKRRNFKERLDFIKMYADWLKKNPNDKWSAQQKNIIDN